jgi:uncharacterized protein (TIGR00251 family)
MIKQIAEGVLLEVRIKPNSKRFALYERGGRLILEVTSQPQEGKANIEIVKGLKKMFCRDVEIVRGLKGRGKLVLIRGAKKGEICFSLEGNK